jgi:hypothetical protein
MTKSIVCASRHPSDRAYLQSSPANLSVRERPMARRRPPEPTNDLPIADANDRCDVPPRPASPMPRGMALAFRLPMLHRPGYPMCAISPDGPYQPPCPQVPVPSDPPQRDPQPNPPQRNPQPNPPQRDPQPNPPQRDPQPNPPQRDPQREPPRIDPPARPPEPGSPPPEIDDPPATDQPPPIIGQRHIR